MKLSKFSKSEIVAPPKWKLFDNCPVCRLFKRAAEIGKRPSQKEIDEAFREAGEIENSSN